MDKRRESTTTLSVHRCRFVDYAPSAVTTLAFPPLPLPSVKGKKKTTPGKQPLRFGTLAVGHANGNIDLCEWAGGEHEVQCPQAWVKRKTLSGPYPSKVDSLAFVIRYPDDLGPDDVPTCADLRLFSSGGGSELLEWDLERSCIRRTISSQGGSIWCIAANFSSTSLALGCEDGTVRILSIENDTLTHSRRFDRVKCRMLSIAWGPPVPRTQQAKLKSKPTQDSDESNDEDDEEDEWSDSWLVTGGSDSSLRKWDVTSGRVIDKMSTDKMRGERTLVWAVGVLGDGTIVSGDSLGMVKFWDSRTCTQLQSFQAHGADVLCLTISPEGKAVYTSGVDQKTTQFSRVKTSNSPATKWAQTASRRMHSHDVRSLAIWPPYTPLPHAFQRIFSVDVAPVLASGGLDMSVVVSPAALPGSTVVKIINPLDTSTESTFEDAYHRRLAYTTGGAMKVARSARMVCLMREAGVTVWRIKSRPEEPEEGEKVYGLDAEPEEAYTGGWEKVLEMDLNVSTNLVACEISANGEWLVVSDLYETKLFSLHTDVKDQLHLKRIKDFTSILAAHIPSTSSPPSTGALAFQFTPDSSKLVMSTSLSSYVLVIDLTGEKPRVLRRFDHHRLRDSSHRAVKGIRKSIKDVEMVDGDAETDAEEKGEDGSDFEEEDSSPLIVNIHQLAISPDGQWLASSDERCRTHVFNLDSISHHSILPSFARPVQAIGFEPTNPSILVLAFPNNTVQIYDIESRQFPAWGKEFSDSLPKRFTLAHDPLLGMTFDPSIAVAEPGKPNSRYVLFYGTTWMFKVAFETHARLLGKKRRREAGGEEERPWRDYKMVTHYRPILYVDFLDKGELVVVERPLVDVLATLPPAYFKHKYGAS
ncbi:WD40-repeat-containing domain protein [Crucibulum laeve]|uniref:WD40-repeat-containing domain protein n=1 Tax=Crucibulum laeve TaxID=68775 RepID=A0A5C3M7K0_9AGAR|nr:WD40-repeat-containing domain protein [Crucibulum laeve]